ncbi:response regulator [Reichenbachiella sp.]|uniref:response regulator n=1 Tax=Reichenbachiella sp. TaxID=2184521 RepID=UPI003BB02488
MQQLKIVPKIFICLFLMSSSVVRAQMDLSWEEIKEPNGLLSNYTYSLESTLEGFLWIGTENGISVFDGFRTRDLFDEADTVKFNIPTYYLKRAKDHMWMSTRSGIHIYDLVQNKFLDVKIGEPRTTEDIYFLSDTKVLVSYYLGFYEIDLDSDGLPINIIDHPLTDLLDTGGAIVNEFFLDSKNQLYISVAGHGVLYGNIKNLSSWSSFSLVNGYTGSKSYAFKQCIAIAETDSNRILLTYINEGVFELNSESGEMSPFETLSILDAGFTPVVSASLNNDYLIIAQYGEGLVCGEVDSFGSSKTSYSFSSLPDFNPLDNQVTSIKVFGNFVWISTLGDGVKHGQLSGTVIRLFSLEDYVDKNSSIYSVKADDDDQLWVATNGDGVLKVKVDESDFVDISQFNTKNNLLGLPTDSINEIHLAKDGSLWIATSQGVVNYSDLHEVSRKLDRKLVVPPRRHWRNTSDSSSISSNMIHDLFEDVDGNIFMTSLSGMNIINTDGKVLSHRNHNEIPYLKENRPIYFGEFLSDSSIIMNGPWINAIYQRNELMNYNEIFPLEKSLYVQHLAHGERYDWIGTTRGLFKYDPKDGRVVEFEGQEFYRSFKLNAVSVSNDVVWMGTNHGLYSYDIKNHKVESFPISTGTGSPYYNLGSVTKNSKGQLFFGTSKGIVMVDPGHSGVNNTSCLNNCQLTVSGAYLNQKRIELSSFKEKERLSFDKVQIGKGDLLELELGFPIYHMHEDLKIEYTLDGQQWLKTTGQSPNVVLYQLSPDFYELKVKATSRAGKSISSIIIPIDVLRPWYARWWAYLIYILILGLMVYVLIKIKINRMREIQHWELEHADLRQRQEVNDLKFEFISNISHELRTPLTLLLNEISGVENQVVSGDAMKKIQSHAQRLKRLANEMLDLKGVGDKELKLTVGEYDVVSFVKDRLDLFQEMASRREITLSLESQKPKLFLWFNPHQFEKVVVNLLSNAIKFTSSGGGVQIKLSVNKGQFDHAKLNGDVDFVKIEVSDSGCGIAEEAMAKLFFSDYSAPPVEDETFDSAGIGLYLCKKIVTLHYGDISVESELTKGTTFVVRMPMGHFHYADEQLERIKSEMTPSALYMMKPPIIPKTSSKKVPVILTVEDNLEIIEIYKKIFAKNYRHHIAKNGIEGIEQAKTLTPDIIITDLSMPGKSGMALIHAIRNDEFLSHIPIIVLTSFASDEQRIKILNQGADAFITKPFDAEVLNARVQNLLSLRLQLKEMFSDKAVSFGDLVKQSPDSDLLKRIISVVEKHMTDPDFDVGMLADQLKMSRSLLYLKLSNLTNYSPKEFIHIMRVRKGAKLLKSGTFRVKEVAYYVGYNSQKNFRKYFKNYHGVAPSDYARQQV